MKNKSKILFLAICLCLALIPFMENSAFAAGAGTLEETHTTTNDGWVKVDDNTWTYTFNVDDDSLAWTAYEADVPDGYATVRTSSDPVSVTNNEAEITNAGKRFTITLQPQGGTYEGSTLVAIKDVYYNKIGNGNIGKPTRDGYTFDGWWTSATGGTQVFDEDGKAKNGTYWKGSGATALWIYKNNLTVYARWKANYTISYNLDGGTHGESHPTSAIEGTSFTVNNPTRTGFDFKGWTISGMGTGIEHQWGNGTLSNQGKNETNTGVYATTFNNLTNVGGSTITFKAVWAEKTAAGGLRYDANGHGTAPEAQDLYYTRAANIAGSDSNPGISETGYDFGGWNTKADGSGNTYAPGALFKEANSLTNTAGTTVIPGVFTVYAKWTAHQYNITYAGLSGATCETKPAKATWDTAFTVSNPTKEGYTFDGWEITGMDRNTHTYGSDTTTATSIDSTKATSFKNLHAENGATVTFTAKWTPNTYTINYDLNGGSYGTNHPTAGTYDTVLTIDAPTKDGYAFIGWEITGMDTCTHYWDNASGTTSRGKATTGDTYRTNATKYKNLRSTSGTVTLTAKWGHYIDIDGNLDGKNSENISKYGTVDVYINDTKVSTGVSEFRQAWPEGTTWEIKNITAATGKTYVSGTNLSGTLGTNNVTAVLTFGTNYTIAYEGMSGATYGTHHPTSAVGGQEFTVNNPTKTGYDFTGWKITGMDDSTHTYGSSTTTATSIDSTKETNFKNLRTSAGTVTFTAQWTAHKYKLTYTLNEGEYGTSHPTTANYGDVITISSPRRAGYSFGGWTITGMDTNTHYWDNDDASTAQGTDQTAEKVKSTKFKNLNATDGATVNLEAVWNPASYTIEYDLKGGTAGASSPTEGTYDEALTISIPEREGYAFEGWTVEGMDSCTHYYGTSASSNIETTDETLTAEQTKGKTWYLNLRETAGTVTFTANWKELKGTIKYNANGHGTAPDDVSIKYSAQANTADALTETGYTFHGWNTKIDGSGTTYEAGAKFKDANSLKSVKNETVIPGETTLYAIWTANKYTITYDANGGTLGTNHPASATYDTAFTVNNPTRTGFYFQGWTISGMTTDCTHYWDNESATTDKGKSATATEVKDKKFKNLRSTAGTVTFTAQWTEMTGTVKYNANGHGTAPADQTVRYTQEAKTANALNVTGFTFKEWNTKDDGTGRTYTAGAKFKDANSLKGINNENIIPDGITLYAIWEEDHATLTYHNQGRGTTPDAQVMHYTKTVKLASALTTEGYAFKGWNTKADGSGKMYAGGATFKEENSYDNVDDITVIPDGIDLYAIWEEMSGDIQFDRNGHGVEYPAQKAWYSKELKMPAGQNCEGYIFKEWNTKADGTGDSYPIGSVYKEANKLKNKSNKTVIPTGGKVYAIWTEQTGKLTFNNNGHGASTNTVTMKYSQEVRIQNMEDVNGWIFLGWATSKTRADNEQVDYKANAKYKLANKLVNVNDETVIPGETTLWAVWVADEGDLVYDVQGHGTAPEPAHLRYKTETSVATNNMTAKGYTFKEWNTEADGSGKTYKPGDLFKEADVFVNTNHDRVVPGGDTLYAIWIENTATLTYNYNDSGTASTNVTMKYSKVTKVTTAIPTKEGCTFKEWNTGRHGTGKSYNPDDVIKQANVEPTDITLYAIWTENTATITYDNNGHGATIDPVTITYTEPAKAANSLSEFGWVFNGWNTKADGTGTEYQPGEEIKPAKTNPTDMTLYAIWTREKHVLTIIGNEGTPATQNIDLYLNSNDNTTLALPTRSGGYVCTGLYTRRNGGNLIYNASGKITNDGTYFKNGVFIYEGDFTLYAQWEEAATACVVYDKNCDDEVTNMPTGETKYINKPIVLKNNIPERDGYTFICWSTASDGNGDCYYTQNGSGSAFPLTTDEAYNNYADGPITLYAIWQEKTDAEKSHVAKLPITYNFYSSDIDNGLLDAEIVYKYTNFFLQDKEVKVRRTIFTDTDQETVPEVVFSRPSWHNGDPIPGLRPSSEPKPKDPEGEDNPTQEGIDATSVKNENELRAIIANHDYLEEDDLNITLADNIEVNSPIEIPAGATVNINFNECKLSPKNANELSTVLKVSGILNASNGTLSAKDKCVTLCSSGIFTADASMKFQDATYAVYFEESDKTATAELKGSKVLTDVLCGTESEHSRMIVGESATISSEGLYADFTAKNAHGLSIQKAYTVANPTVYVNANEFIIQGYTLDGFNYRVYRKDEAKVFIIKAMPEDIGLGTVEGDGGYLEDEQVTLTATPNSESIEFVGWVDEDGKVVSNQAEWTFECEKDIDVMARFRLKPHTITVSANNNKMGSVTGGGEYGETETATLTAEPKANYEFVGWVDEKNPDVMLEPQDDMIIDDNVLKIVVKEDASYRAIFKPTGCTVHIDIPDGFSNDEGDDLLEITANGESPDEEGNAVFEYGQEVTLEATVNGKEGYSIKGFYDVDTDEYVSEGATYNFNIEEDINLTVVVDIDDDAVDEILSRYKEQQQARIKSEFTAYRSEFYDKLQPVGSIYTSTDASLGKGKHYNDETIVVDGETVENENYHVDLGVKAVEKKFGGEWERIENKFLYAQGDEDTLGDTGGKFRYDFSLAMNVGENSLAYVLDDAPGLDSDTYVMKQKFTASSVTPTLGVIVTDSESTTRTTKIVPPYQSVYVFKRVN